MCTFRSNMQEMHMAYNPGHLIGQSPYVNDLRMFLITFCHVAV